MPPNKKKRKAPKDFEKRVIKVGKGKLKPGAANKTDTTFTAKKMVVKDQTIPDEIDIQARRYDLVARMSLYLSQLGHYSCSFRKEAVLSLGRCLKEQEDLALYLNSVYEGLLRTVIDEDPGVRQAAFPIWVYLLRERTSSSEISLTLNLIVPHIILGLTHLKKDICGDAARILVVAKEAHPEALKLFVPSLLPAVTRHFSGKSFEQPANKAIDLVQLFTGLCQLLVQESTSSRRSLDYIWIENQTRALRAQPRKMDTQPDALAEEEIKKVLLPVINAALPIWSETGYLLASPSFASTDKEEQLLFMRCVSVLSSCWRLARMSGVDFDGLVPKKVAMTHNWTLLQSKFE